jgi:hypothetical protein
MLKEPMSDPELKFLEVRSVVANQHTWTSICMWKAA